MLDKKLEICTVCKSSNIKLLKIFDIGRSYICNNCKSIINDPLVNTDSVYDENYYENNYNAIIEDQKKTSYEILNKLKEFSVENNKILDYGCGTGVFLYCANNLGYEQLVGVDVSKDAITFAKKHSNNKFYELLKFNTTSELKTQQFNVITFLDSIGHIRNIQNIFKNLIKNRLDNNGERIIVIRTPRINKLYLWYIKSILFFAPNKYLQSLFFMPNRHVVFNQKSINIFLKRFNFEVLSIDYQNDYKSNLNYLNMKSFLKSIIKIVPKIINPNNSMLIIARKAQ